MPTFSGQMKKMSKWLYVFWLRRDFSKILRGRIASPDLEALEKVLFDTVYPTLGSR
jgi:hypothetical protein